MKILAFGIVAEKTGAKEFACEDIPDSDSLYLWLRNTYPELRKIKFSIAINRKLAQVNTKIDDGSEVALLPPFSGG